MTVLEPGSESWLKLVTPSKIAPILGISPYSDQYTTWHMMAGDLPPEKITDAMRRGTLHESAVLREFYFDHPELTHIDGSDATVMVSEWLAYTPDSIAVDKNGARWLVEAKTAGEWDMWGRDGTDEIPEHYLAQVITCAYLAGCTHIRVKTCGPFWDYREYPIEPNTELARAVLSLCHEFWKSVQSGEEPDLSRTVASYKTWSKVAEPVGEGSVEIDPTLAVEFLRAIDGEKAVKPTKAAIAQLIEKAGAKEAVVGSHQIAVKQRGAHGMEIRASRKRPAIEQLLETAS